MPVMQPKLPGGAGTLGGQRGLLPPSRPQIVASHNAIPNATWGNGAGGRTDTLSYSRRTSLIGAQAVSQLQLGFVGYYIKNDATGEHAFGNDYTATAALEITSPAIYRDVYANGVQSINVPNGVSLLLAAPLNIDLAAGTALRARQMFQVASSAGNLFPSCSQGVIASGILKETGFVAPSIATSQVDGTGDVTTVTGASAFGGALPAIILGIPAAPMAAVILLGDSIADGTGDLTVSVASGALGYLARGLDSVNGFTVPYHKQTAGGDQLAQNTLAISPRKRDAWQYATHIIIQLGTNDIAAASLSTMQTNMTALLTAAKRTIGPYGKPLQTAACCILPKTTSSNSFVDAAGQTIVSGYTIGGLRDQYNTWLKSLVGGGLLDAVIDANPYVEDQAHLGKWITTGAANYPSTDGTHPTTAVHILAAQAVNNWAVGIRP